MKLTHIMIRCILSLASKKDDIAFCNYEHAFHSPSLQSFGVLISIILPWQLISPLDGDQTP